MTTDRDIGMPTAGQDVSPYAVRYTVRYTLGIHLPIPLFPRLSPDQVKGYGVGNEGKGREKWPVYPWIKKFFIFSRHVGLGPTTLP